MGLSTVKLINFVHAGDGGNEEGLYKTFAGTGTCPNAACQIVAPNAGPQYCVTLQNNLYAPAGGAQPS